jgi:hypothetical protein
MTGIVASTLALLIAMIIALDWPFRGKISVSPRPLYNDPTFLGRAIDKKITCPERAWGKLICRIATAESLRDVIANPPFRGGSFWRRFLPRGQPLFRLALSVLLRAW